MTKKNSKNPSISVIIPTYNGVELLKQNLPAVFRSLRDKDEVVIVDDASSDPTVDWFWQQFSPKTWKKKIRGKTFTTLRGSIQLPRKKINVVLLKNRKNLRFAKAVNAGVLNSKHTIVFLLNNDVSPHAKCVEQAVPHFSDTSVFGVGCLEFEDTSTADAQNTPQLPKIVHVPRNKVVGGKNTLFFRRGLFQHARAENFSFGETGWVSGGSGFFDKKKWLSLGGFDPDYYPAYWEDIDLSYRARKRGWKVLFEPLSQVDHNHESTNKTVFGQLELLKLSWKNADLFVKKNGTIAQKIAFMAWRPYWWWHRGRHSRKVISYSNEVHLG